jgi:hypothetical protein
LPTKPTTISCTIDDAALLAAELEDRDYYREVNVFWVPEAARWEASVPPPSSPTSASASTTRCR